MERERMSTFAGASQRGSGMTRDEIAALFERREALYNDLDAAALVADYADDVVIESPSVGVHTGRRAAEQTLRAAFAAFMDMKVRTDSLLIDGDRVVQVLEIDGTHIGDFMGVSPTGKHFRLVAVFLSELRNRQIVRERRFYDFTGLLVQIGLLKARPV